MQQRGDEDVIRTAASRDLLSACRSLRAARKHFIRHRLPNWAFPTSPMSRHRPLSPFLSVFISRSVEEEISNMETADLVCSVSFINLSISEGFILFVIDVVDLQQRILTFGFEKRS